MLVISFDTAVTNLATGEFLAVFRDLGLRAAGRPLAGDFAAGLVDDGRVED
jgi:hypothetical protein